MNHLHLKSFSEPGLIALANAVGEELKRWAEDGHDSTEDFADLDNAFKVICLELESRGVVVSDHVIVP